MAKRQLVVDGEGVEIEDGKFADGRPCYNVRLLDLQDYCTDFAIPAWGDFEGEIQLRVITARGIRNYQEWLAIRNKS